jgi:hypothetical protein
MLPWKRSVYRFAGAKVAIFCGTTKLLGVFLSRNHKKNKKRVTPIFILNVLDSFSNENDYLCNCF